MDTKSYTASIYSANFSKDSMPSDSTKDLFCTQFNGDQQIDIPTWKHRGYNYDIIMSKAGTGCYKGIIKKFGHDALPHAGKPKGEERELEIKEDESTIERSHFLYYKKHHLLVWQENRTFGPVGTLSAFLSDILGHTVIFNPVLTTEATLQLLLEQHKPKVIDFSVAAPSNPTMYDPKDDSERTLRMLHDLGAMSGSFRVSANAQGVKGRFLDAAKTFALAESLVKSGKATKVRLELEDISHPVDLILDRMREKIEVEMNGRYPIEKCVFEQLAQVKDSFDEELKAIFP